jgi:hypothetical protein
VPRRGAVTSLHCRSNKATGALQRRIAIPTLGRDLFSAVGSRLGVPVAPQKIQLKTSF